MYIIKKNLKIKRRKNLIGKYLQEHRILVDQNRDFDIILLHFL